MCSVHLISTYYVRNGSLDFYFYYPQINEVGKSDHVVSRRSFRLEILFYLLVCSCARVLVCSCTRVLNAENQLKPGKADLTRSSLAIFCLILHSFTSFHFILFYVCLSFYIFVFFIHLLLSTLLSILFFTYIFLR